MIYHSGFKGLEDALPTAEEGFKKISYVPCVSNICSWKKKNPQVNNIYMEMGSTFAMMVSSSPLLAAYVMGMIIDAFGSDHVLWGTEKLRRMYKQSGALVPSNTQYGWVPA
jgi:uncharacterized protein